MLTFRYLYRILLIVALFNLQLNLRFVKTKERPAILVATADPAQDQTDCPKERPVIPVCLGLYQRIHCK